MKNRARSKRSPQYQVSARDTGLGFPFRAPKQSLIWRLSASMGWTELRSGRLIRSWRMLSEQQTLTGRYEDEPGAQSSRRGTLQA